MKRTPLRKTSKKRAAQLREYAARRKAFLFIDKPHYFAGCGVRGCVDIATEIHHKKGREGKWLLDEKYWMPVCRFHHARIEENRAWAKEQGYLLPRR